MTQLSFDCFKPLAQAKTGLQLMILQTVQALTLVSRFKVFDSQVNLQVQSSM